MNETLSATPRCPHFGSCGGCQYQDIVYDEQLRLKASRLEGLLREANVARPQRIVRHSAEPYEYRNRIRLRIERVEGVLRVGYNRPASTEFLPIVTCPIAAPVLWRMAEALLAATSEREVEYWLNATAEVEIFCDATESRVQITFFCAPRTKSPPKSQPGNFGSAFALLQKYMPVGVMLAGASAVAFDARTGPTGRTLVEAGASGLSYRVGEIDYWITRGAFFQVNRFLVDTLVQLVTDQRSGDLAWDLFAGVGLFSRVLARSFAQVVAIESHPVAVADLRNALGKLGPQHVAVESTTLDFLQKAVTQRERPDLIVLDPPRAGAGVEACELIARLAPKTIVYVSCDPATLARDLAVLQAAYSVKALHLVDLFPQTSHLETVAILERIR
jgi:23S rRNA (uracil1939-C5)-methyltransferase